jgi:putative transcriptional regulator
MVNQRGYSTVTDNLDRLCKYFNCKVSDIAEYVPDDEVGNP